MDTYLDAVLDPVVQRITLIDAPAVLGADTGDSELERDSHAGARALIDGAVRAGHMREVDPDALAHLIRGACLQAAVLIARSPEPRRTRGAVGATLATWIEGLRA